MAGTPTLQYRIPYETASPHAHWHVIVTDKARHFYFNRETKESLWQLEDIKTRYQELDWEAFVASFEYEKLAVMFGRVRGVQVGKSKEKETKKTVKQQEEEEEQHEDEVEEKEEEDDDDEQEEDVNDDTQDLDIDTEARDEFIANMLKEEGYLQEKTTDNEQDTPGDPNLILGYSSSEDEDDEEEEVNDVEQEDEAEEKEKYEEDEEEEKDEEDEEESSLQLDLSLDLSVDSPSTDNNDEFKAVLDTLKSKISIYETWLFIEEELINELVTFPGYYLLNKTSREKVFNEWCQEQEQQPAVETPTVSPTMHLLNLLQQHKDAVKSQFYQEFSHDHNTQLAAIDLSSMDKNKLYVKFRTLLVDFAKYEKETKKQQRKHSTSTLSETKVNLKKLHLEKFLETNRNQLVRPRLVVAPVLALVPPLAPFERWLWLGSSLKVPLDLVEDVSNFIVGDDKRLEAYVQFYSRIVDP